MTRRMWTWLIAAIIVVGGVVIALAVMNVPDEKASKAESAESAPTPTAPPLAPATTELDGKGESADEAEALVAPLIAAESAARQSPENPVLFEEIAAGDALEDLQLDAFEFVENGLVQSGTPEIVSAEITSLKTDASPPTAKVRLCLDYSSVDVLTPDGVSVKDENAPNRVPSLLTLQQLEGRWLATKRGYPDEVTC